VTKTLDVETEAGVVETETEAVKILPRGSTSPAHAIAQSGYDNSV